MGDWRVEGNTIREGVDWWPDGQTCRTCGGSGYDDSYEPCEVCGGEGEIRLCAPNINRGRSQVVKTAEERLLESIERYEARVAQAREQLAQVQSRPAEPDYAEEPVIRWDMRFCSHGTVYSYVALRCAADGLWYTTGPRSPKGYTWDQLMSWIESNQVVGRIWIVSDYEELS